jgi:protein-tyrosine-phosphatase
MSRILFVCSGNTCRSPMAAGIARRVFGASHSILSAGAETTTGRPAARYAISTMSEMGVDVAKHSSRTLEDVDLTSFDLVVVFRPSAAQCMAFPPSLYVQYLDVADPYGGTIDTYRTAARSIERAVRRLYVDDAVRRASTVADAAGSHVSGMLNRAAKECEKEVGEFARRQIGVSVHDKATLGQLARDIEKYSMSRNRPDLAELSAAIAEANAVWVPVKHRDDPSVDDLIDGLKAIQKVFQLLE